MLNYLIVILIRLLYIIQCWMGLLLMYYSIIRNEFQLVRHIPCYYIVIFGSHYCEWFLGEIWIGVVFINGGIMRSVFIHSANVYPLLTDNILALRSYNLFIKSWLSLSRIRSSTSSIATLGYGCIAQWRRKQ